MTDSPQPSPTKKKKLRGGCCIALVLAFILLVILWVIGTFVLEDEEPEAEPAVTVEMTTEPEEVEASEEPAEEEAPEATEEPTEEAAEEPAEEASEEPAEESEETTGEEPTEEPDTTSVETIQGNLDTWFEGCDWQTTENDGITMSSCEKHEIGIIVGPGDSSVQGILDAMGEEASTGGYFIEDGVAVWATDMGTVNMAWDALGTPGTPTQF